MLKNVTLSAEDRLIAQARQRAQRERKTLNAAFREWLAAYVGKGAGTGRYRELKSKLKHISAGRKFSRDELTNRLFLPMLLEATRMLEEKIVRDVRDVDLGLIFGLGFPPFKGGLLYWADTIGAAMLLEMIKPLEPLGARFQPTPLLKEMASKRRKFYPKPE